LSPFVSKTKVKQPVGLIDGSQSACTHPPNAAEAPTPDADWKTKQFGQIN